MMSLSLSRRLVWGIVLFMGMAVLVPAQNLPAQEAGCYAVDAFGLPRECTFLEEHGSCLWTALESYSQCVEDSKNLWNRILCEAGLQVDLFVCNVTAPLTLIKTIMT